MSQKLSKSETVNQIQEFFKHIKDKTPKDVKKIKRLVASKNIKLGGLRKKFCKKCLMPYTNKEKVRIKNGKRLTICNACGHVARWKWE